MQSGIAHHQAGHLSQAAEYYKRVLEIDPSHADALNLLGLINYQIGNNPVAVDLMRKAVGVDPSKVLYHSNLGVVYQVLGQLDEAASCYKNALAIEPDFAEAHYNLGTILGRQGKLDEASASYRKALALTPNNAGAHNNLGNILADQGKLEDASVHYRNAVELQPNYAEAHYNMGTTLEKGGNLDEAVVCYKKALDIRPDYPDALNNLGSAHNQKGSWNEAISCYQKALAIKPDYAEAHNNLGVVLNSQGKLGEALTCFETALAIRPDFLKAQGNLGNAFTEMGRLREAVSSFRTALSLTPDAPDVHSNLLLAMQYTEMNSSPAIYAESLHFAEHFEAPLRHDWPQHANCPDPMRKLRVGYVSADFRKHSVAYFFQSILANHDKTGIETYCYYNNFLRDTVTEKIARLADRWVPSIGMTDQQLADRIRADAIDILVDLGGHTAHNRLSVFARKPAPVQVTYLGYPGTTGLAAMDYRLTDKVSDPEDNEVDDFYSEQLIRLPETFLCFQPDADSPDIGPLPLLKGGNILFGSFNHFPKIIPMIETWARILLRCPGARLAIKAGGLQEAGLRQDLTRLFAGNGIAEDRLILLGRDATTADHLARYNQIDVALDSYPYNGTTTTCEALWMGVPVVTLAGTRHVSRVGASLLSVVGLKDLIASCLDHYVDTAVSLANDVPRLQALRSGMRHRLSESPLLNGPRLTKEIEKTYRDIWVSWCNREAAIRS